MWQHTLCVAVLHSKPKKYEEVDMQKTSCIWTSNLKLKELSHELSFNMSDFIGHMKLWSKQKESLVMARHFQSHTPTQLDGDLRSGIQVMSKYYHCCWHIKRFRSGSGLTWLLIMCDELSTPLHILLYFTFVPVAV